MKTVLTRLNENTLWSLAGGAVPALAALAAIPLFIFLLGIERFALLSLLLALNLFFFVYDFGLARAMHFFVPKDTFQDEKQAIKLVSTGLFLAFVIGIAVTIFIFLLSPVFVHNWLNLSEIESSEMALAFQVASLGLVPAIMMGVLRGRFEGADAFKDANRAKIFSGVSLFLLPMLAAVYTDSLVWISAVMTASRFFALIVYIKLTKVMLYKFWTAVDFLLFSKIKTYAFWAAISGFFATAFIYADRFFVAGFVTQTELSIYIASQDIVSRYLIIPWSVAIVLTPYFASEKYTTAYFKLAHANAFKKIAALTLLFFLAALVVIYYLLPLWLESEFVSLTQVISLILLVGVVFASVAQLPLVFLYAQGKAKLLSFIFMSEGVLYLCFAPFLYEKFGVLGAAGVWSARLFIEMLLLFLVANRMMRN